jgi:hypothetical protein
MVIGFFNAGEATSLNAPRQWDDSRMCHFVIQLEEIRKFSLSETGTDAGWHVVPSDFTHDNRRDF